MQLALALLRVWLDPSVAFANARVNLREATATGCPLRKREWRQAMKVLKHIFPDCDEPCSLMAWDALVEGNSGLTVTIAELVG